jgi:hypothetical protein
MPAASSFPGARSPATRIDPEDLFVNPARIAVVVFACVFAGGFSGFGQSPSLPRSS